jgi:hypothetical protein
VPAQTLDEVLAAAPGGDGRLAWLKLGCQGCEYAVLPALSGPVPALAGRLSFEEMRFAAPLPLLSAVEAAHDLACPRLQHLRECAPGYGKVVRRRYDT